MSVFVLEKDSSYPNGYWWLVSSGSIYDIGKSIKVENRLGGCHEHIVVKDDVFCRADDWDDLNWEDACAD